MQCGMKNRIVSPCGPAADAFRRAFVAQRYPFRGGLSLGLPQWLAQIAQSETKWRLGADGELA
jgi:hypothetical protein